jgi:hypothetical protein
MRDLKRSENNRLVMTDGVTGEKIVVFYSTPLASQIKAYRQASIKRKGDKVVMNTFDPALKYGLEILTGFEEGAFGYDGKPISADPASPNYREDWKNLLAETAADIVTIVAAVAFDGVKVEKTDSGIEFEGEGAEEILPLVKSSTA